MNANDIVVVAADLAIAAGLGWWFFGPKKTTETALEGDAQTVRVTVHGGYSPNRIRARVGVPLRLVFDRQESGDCTSRVVFPDFGVSADLPAFAETTVELPPELPGEYGFACGMNMIHGVLTVEDCAGQPAGVVTAPDHHAESDDAETAIAERVDPAGPQTAAIVVDGGYHPHKILAHAGVPLRLVFDRQESGDCTSRVVFPDFGVSADLPAFAETTVDLPSLDAGHFGFSCGMQMVHGEIDVVVDGAPARSTDHAVSEANRPSSVIVPPVVRDGSAHPQPDGADSEAAERRAEIADLTRRVAVGAVLTLPRSSSA